MTGLVVTGLGVLAPTGTNPDAFWKSTEEGVSAIAPITRFDATGFPLKLGGEVHDFRAEEAIEGRYLVQTDLFTHFALAASDLALADAELDPTQLDPYDLGVLMCSYAGGVEFGQREIQQLWSKGPKHVGPYQSIAWFYAASTGQVSIRRGLKGPCAVLVNDEAGVLDSFGHAARTVRRGTPMMLVGGTEAPLTSPFALACQVGGGLLSDGTDPATAYLPFDSRARGYVPAEGGAVFVTEEAGVALARGARIRAVVAGQASTFSGALAFDPTGEGLERAIRAALAEAGRRPEDVDVVFADALGVPAADASEAAVLRRVFPAGVPVTAPKAGFGRAYAGASAIDVAAALLSIEHGAVPPTPNVTGGTYDLDLVTGAARQTEVGTALVLARGFGGTNSALVLCHPDDPIQG
jgi:minimal PKS chain-length factor (CLF/KS beta)